MTDPTPDLPGPTGPIEPEAPAAPATDETLAGYLATHDRPPAFESVDGHPYTVSLEVERTGDLPAPCKGYLVFPRWAANGVGIIGHVESATLAEGGTRAEAEAALGRLSLIEVQSILDEAVVRAGHPTPPHIRSTHAP